MDRDYDLHAASNVLQDLARFGRTVPRLQGDNRQDDREFVLYPVAHFLKEELGGFVGLPRRFKRPVKPLRDEYEEAADEYKQAHRSEVPMRTVVPHKNTGQEEQAQNDGEKSRATIEKQRGDNDSGHKNQKGIRTGILADRDPDGERQNHKCSCEAVADIDGLMLRQEPHQFFRSRTS